MDITYETHLTIKKDKLCPFKLLIGTIDGERGICNWHENIEVLLIKGGDGRVLYGSEYLDVSDGSIIVVNSEALHRLCGDGYDILGFIIDSDFCKENGIDTSALVFERCFFDDEIARIMKSTASTVKSYTDAPTSLGGARARCAVLELLIKLTERHSAVFCEIGKERRSSEEYVKTVIKHLNAHSKEEMSLEELAALCGITKYHLSREFKRYTGSTVFSYLNVLKCKNAEGLILHGKSVSEAAFESGFESLSYFSRTYKKIMGRSPSAIIRRR